MREKLSRQPKKKNNEYIAAKAVYIVIGWFGL
jgi:hypothetical protein